MMQQYAAAAASGYGLDGVGHHHQQHLPQHHQQPDGGDGGQGQVVEGVRGHADISTILDQIMNITDQSLDEAQVYLERGVTAWE